MFFNTVQALPQCKGEDHTKWTNCQGTYLKNEYKPGLTRDYTGEFGKMRGKRHGKGTSKVYKDGKLSLDFIGNFKNDKSYGVGVLTFTNGEQLIGEWKDGIFHGHGTHTLSNGNKYVGEWKDGKRHGQGTYIFVSGHKFVGEWKDDKQHGQGTFIFPDGRIYIGKYKDSKRNGQGVDTFSNGEIYIGEYKDGKRNGQGTLTFPDGRVEKGIWRNDKLIKAELSEKDGIVESALSDDEIYSDHLIKDGNSKKDAKCIVKKFKQSVKDKETKKHYNIYIELLRKAATDSSVNTEQDLPMESMWALLPYITGAYTKCGVPLE